MNDTTLGRYFSLNKSGIEPRFYSEESFYYYNLPDYDTGEKVTLSQGKFIDSNKFLVHRESVLISKLNPRIKRVWLVRNDGCFRSISSTEFVNLIPNDNANVDYLFFFLQQDWLFKQLEAEAVGTTNSHVRFKPDLLCGISGKFPPLPQQRKIARILTTVDNLIEKTETLIAKYQAIKQGMMHDIFTRGVDEHGHLRPPYEEAPELYKQSELGWIPKEWGTDELHNRTLQIIDGTHFTPIYTEEGVPFLRVTDIQEETINFEELKFVSEQEHRILCQRCLPQHGDILLSKNGTIGIPKIVDWDWPFSIFVSLALIRPKHDQIETRFLYYIFLSNIVWEQIRRRSKQGTVTNLHLEEIRELVVPLPETAEQKRITERLDAMNCLIRSEQSLLTKLRLRKIGLMQDLLTGKVRVRVDETE